MKASRSNILCSCLLLLLLSHLCSGRNLQSTQAPSFRFKAVNLGGWLVTEGWIKPSLFDGIQNKDLLDGSQVQFKSTAWGKYLCAEKGGDSIIVANRSSPSGWETFKLWRVTEDRFQFRVFDRHFVGLNVGGGPSSSVLAVATAPGVSETFQIIRKPDDPNRVLIRAPNGMFLQAKSEDMVTADFSGEPGWEDGSTAVFLMNPFGGLRGEFQLTNGYGPGQSAQVMHDHWNTFIVEDDFAFISKNGLNSVRIPVGWWTAMNPTPSPFVEGSLDVLDRAFTWAEKYGLKVILDLHAAPYSQNGWEHSASRDGTIEFGSTQETIDKTVAVIEFFSSRYARSPSLAAVELINEPRAPDVSLDALTRYYKAGYDAVRRHSSAYVIMCNRLGWPSSPTEFFALANGLSGTVIDVHYYNLYESNFDNMSAQQNIDFIYQTRASQLNTVTSANGPLSFVGEWTAEWQVKNAAKEDYQKFAKAQLDVFGRASFGWAYWTLKNVNQHWSLRWMIENGYITI